MLVKLAAIVAEARGSVGGVTFARNRYGAYARNRTKPVDPASSTQQEYRARMSAAVVAWRNLTATQRDAFNAKALVTDFVNGLGEAIHPTGMALFIRGFNLLDIAGLAQVTTPPVTPIIDEAQSTLTYTADPGLQHNTTVADWPTGATMLLWHTRNLSNSTYYYKGPYIFQISLLAAGYTADVKLLAEDASLDADSSQFAMWRLVGTDGAASALRRGRAFKPPA